MIASNAVEAIRAIIRSSDYIRGESANLFSLIEKKHVTDIHPSIILVKPIPMRDIVYGFRQLRTR